MADVIKLLPESLANQIAAGEVVQRPASVVKELLENAIDANATHIKLVIKEAGKTWIQVMDNGSGMSETDARMSFERHATSKISKTDDLFTIMTMGFRGEALASIAAVAQVEMKTKKATDDTGTLLQVEGSQIIKIEPTQCNSGTSITVKNLFFNVPARRNFLKSTIIEFAHIQDEFFRIAMAHPEISFSLFNQDADLFQLSGGKLANRITALLGNQFKGRLSACMEETNYLKITGYIGKPECAKRKRGEQYFFANKRFIKHALLHYAVKECFKGLIDENEHPFYVLFLEIDPKHIDINVHPTKTEIKFDDERTVFQIVNSAVRKALANSNLNVIDFSENVNNEMFAHFSSRKSIEKTPSNSNYSSNYEKKSTENWQTLYANLEKKTPNQDIMQNQDKVELKFKSNFEAIHEIEQTEIKAEHTILFQIHNSFIITQTKSGMMMIDQQAAHERVLYDKFMKTLETKFGASQQFLFPLNLEVSPSDFELIMELKDQIHALGFSFSVFGKNSIVINGIPTDVRAGNEKALFEGFIDQYKSNKSQLKLPVNENLARSLAKKSALKKGVKIDLTQMSNLLEQLLSSPNPSFAPDGTYTIVSFDLQKLNELFQ
ncbi:MAG: DNA mismatch repair endonuclease MutL [Cytophagales bacterium]|nr:MAG: DNA mismatch repair endonuclease MutL [Cytophagales bacterium]